MIGKANKNGFVAAGSVVAGSFQLIVEQTEKEDRGRMLRR